MRLPMTSIGFFVLILCTALPAFTPYEIYLLSDRPTHVGLIAQASQGQEEALAQGLHDLASDKYTQAFSQVGITNISSYSKEIHGATWFVVYFTFDGTREYLSAAEAFESVPVAAALKPFLISHPRAVRYQRQWLQMEWINFIHGKDVKRPATNKTMIVTRIRPEKEAEYRTLHQTVWPGVVDQVVRGNIRDLNVFLVEMEGDLVEFLYLEYVGDDEEADDAMNKADPINIRWWKQTDACQIGLSGEGNWVLMDEVNDN